jgi:hypothetical protein
MQDEHGLLKDIGLWIREHRTLVISAGNAVVILVLACILAVALEVSATKRTYAEARAPRTAPAGEADRYSESQPVSEAPRLEEEGSRPAPRLRVRPRLPGAHRAPQGPRVEVRPRGYVPPRVPTAGETGREYPLEHDLYEPESIEDNESSDRLDME